MRTSSILWISVLSFLLVGCGDDDTNTQLEGQSPASNLVLYSHQTIYSTPSNFLVFNDGKSYQCDRAIFVNGGSQIDLNITSGILSDSGNETFCTFDNLPERTAENSTLIITYSEVDELNNPLETFTSYYVNIKALENDIGNRPIRVINTLDEYDTSITASTGFTPERIESSGLGRALVQAMLERKEAEVTEQEAVNAMLAINNTGVYTAADIISYANAYDADKRAEEEANTGVISDESIIINRTQTIPLSEIENSFSNYEINLEEHLPFLAELTVEGDQGWYVIAEYRSTHIIVVHPYKGYIKIPFDKDNTAEFGNVLINDTLELVVFNVVEPEEE